MKHGGLAQFNLEDGDSYLDLSVNLNPYAKPWLPKLDSALVSRYPDPHSTVLVTTIARMRSCLVGGVVVGNGASELIGASLRVLLKAGDGFLTIAPCFSEAMAKALQIGANVLELVLDEADDFFLCFLKLERMILENKPKVLSLCNPMSPTGRTLAPEDIARLASNAPDLTILLDESFLSMSNRNADRAFDYPSNVIRLVSLTKDHAIAGVRLGYCLAEPPLAAKIRDQLPSWNVNAFAQLFSEELEARDCELEMDRIHIFRDRSWFEEELRKRNIHFIASQTIYLMFRHSYPGLQKKIFLSHRVLIRCCKSYGLKNGYRVGIRPEADMSRFLEALDSLVQRVHADSSSHSFQSLSCKRNPS